MGAVGGVGPRSDTVNTPHSTSNLPSTNPFSAGFQASPTPSNAAAAQNDVVYNNIPHLTGHHSSSSFYGSGNHTIGPYISGQLPVGPPSASLHASDLHGGTQYTLVPHPSGSHAQGPHSSGQHVSGAHSSGQHPGGSHSGSQHTGGPHSSSQHASGPHASGQHSSGSHSSGQHSSGSHGSGAHSSTAHNSILQNSSQASGGGGTSASGTGGSGGTTGPSLQNSIQLNGPITAENQLYTQVTQFTCI